MGEIACESCKEDRFLVYTAIKVENYKIMNAFVCFECYYEMKIIKKLIIQIISSKVKLTMWDLNGCSVN